MTNIIWIFGRPSAWTFAADTTYFSMAQAAADVLIGTARKRSGPSCLTQGAWAGVFGRAWTSGTFRMNGGLANAEPDHDIE